MGTKAMCGVINTDGDALPLLATDNADGTATLKVDTEITATIDPSGLATTAKQDTGNGYLTTLAGAVSGTEMQVDLVGSVPAGTAFIGRSGLTGFKVLQTFTRPGDTNAYTALDAITNSTSSPAIMSQDLASFGATAGRFLVITNARVISSVKGSGLSANIHIYPASFTATNDNAELSIDDTTAALGGITIPCLNNYTTALNARAVSDPGWWQMQLGAASTTIYFALQATSAYTPANAEVFTVVMQGFFL